MSTDKKYDVDYLFEDLTPLVSEEFKSWYISSFYKLGKRRVLEIASIATADGKDKKRLFSYLLKKELRK